MVRAGIAPDLPDGWRSSRQTAWRSLVPAVQAPAGSRRPLSNLWLGPKLHLVHYPVHRGALINVVAIVEDRWEETPRPDFWSMQGDGATIRQRFRSWHPDATALIEAAPDWRVWPLFDRPPLERWSKGAVTLLGDAAHPMLPFLAQGASQAIEDAWALHQAVARHPADLPKAFAEYEARRRHQADRVQRESRRQGRVYHLPSPASALRDMSMRALGSSRMQARYDWIYGSTSSTISS